MRAAFSFGTNSSESIAYRPEIDGLRALAVMSVVFYHAGLGCPGGYVGVDVFFVISGFLITSLILRDVNAGRFCLAEFWERRIRRILPALSVMVLVSLLIGALLLLPRDYARLGRSTIAQALLVANIYFWRDDAGQGGYFGPTSEERPLLHTWSLAVEEQFYLFFPLTLLLLFRFERFRRPQIVSLFLGTGLIAGLALSVYGMEKSPGATFYLLPTRAWELLCGAWIASLPAAFAPRGRIVREGASWIGLVGILLPAWIYTRETPFPGLAALLPCAGTALFIWSNTRLEGGRVGMTIAGHLLAMRPVVFVGLISYSLYLWHWPVLVFGNYWWVQTTTPWTHRVGLVLIAALLAVISWRYVETPFRRGIVISTRPAAFRFAAACMMISILAGSSLVASLGLPGRMPLKVLKNDEARLDRACSVDMDIGIEEILKGRLYPLGDRNSAATPKVLLWGDSHAMHSVPALDALCLEMGVTGCAAMHSSTPPLLNAAFQTENGLDEKAPDFSAAVFEQIKKRGIRHVVLAGYWSDYQKRDAHLLETTLGITIRALEEAGCKVWVLQDVPDMDLEPTRVLARIALFGSETTSWGRRVDDHHRRNAVIYRMAGKNLPATFLDPSPRLLDVGNHHYRADIDGISIYEDKHHLTKAGSLSVLLPMLREAMSVKLMAVP